MTWQDATLTAVSLAFIAALVPSIVQRRTAPLSSCTLTATGLLIIGAVDFTFHPVILFAATTTLITSAMWWACARIAWQQQRHPKSANGLYAAALAASLEPYRDWPAAPPNPANPPCPLSKPGWWCSLPAGHDGPCPTWLDATALRQR